MLNEKQQVTKQSVQFESIFFFSEKKSAERYPSVNLAITRWHWGDLGMGGWRLSLSKGVKFVKVLES